MKIGLFFLNYRKHQLAAGLVMAVFTLTACLRSSALLPVASENNAQENVDLLSPQFGATAYASSFSLELDPRKVLSRTQGAVWKPLAGDGRPRFYLVWPGDVVFDRLRIQGNVSPATVQIYAGQSRFGLRRLAATGRRESDGTTVLSLTAPAVARVLELHFAPRSGASLKSVGVYAADSEGIEVARTIDLKAREPRALSAAAGQKIRFIIPPALLAANRDKPRILEVEKADSTPYRLYQDYRAGRALLLPQDKGAGVVCQLLNQIAGGVYDIYLSQLESTTRTRIGSITIDGRPAMKPAGAGLPRVAVDLTSRRLPRLNINGESIPAVMMVMAAPSWDKIAAYHRTGSRLWRFNASSTALLEGPDISRNVAAVLKEVDSNAENILALAPDVYLLVSLDTRPRATWLARYPEAVQRNAKGTMGFGVNFASATLRRDLRLAARLFVEGLAQKPYAARVAGVLPYFGRGGDGWGYGIDQAGFVRRDKIAPGDRSPDEEAGFTAWLEKRYGRPLSRTLEGHWQSKAIQAPKLVPSDERLAAPGQALFIDPETRQDVIDYWQFRADSVQGAITEFGDVVKQASGGRLLYGTHYGYTMASLRNQAPGVTQLGGHTNLKELLEAKSTDWVNGGSSGDKRGATANYEAVTPLGSVLLHNKMPVLELDNRTPLTRGVPPYEYYQLFSFDEFLQGARKDVGFALTHGAALHWYDMSTPHSANPYFREPWYMEESFYALCRQTMKTAAEPASGSALAAPVAVFIDEKVAASQDIYDSFVYENLTRFMSESFAQAGVGYRVYLLSDYDRWSKTSAAKETKLEVFLNGWLSGGPGWKTVAASGRPQLWFYGADLLSSQKLTNGAGAASLLGFRLAARGRLSISQSQCALTAAFRKSYPVMPASYSLHPYGPLAGGQRSLFGESLAAHYVPIESASMTVLARFADGRPGLVEGRLGGRRRLFSSLPYIPASVLRGLYQRVGIRPGIPWGSWWSAEGRGLQSINIQEKLYNPQVLQSWLKQRSPLPGFPFAAPAPGRSYIVRKKPAG